MTRALVRAVALLALLARPAAAQWAVDASAGGAEHDAVAASAGTRSAMLGVRYQGPRWGYLAAGVPMDSAGLPWAALGLGGRLAGERWGVEVGTDLSAQGHGYRAPALQANGGGLVLDVLPYLAWARGATRVEVSSGLRHYRSVFDGAATSRSVSDSELRLATLSSPALRLELRGRYLRAEEGGYPFAGAAAEMALGRAGFSAHAGRWLAETLSDAAWGAAARLAVPGRTTVYAAVDQEAPDPLYWNARRRSWTLGVSRAFGPGSAPGLGDAMPVVPVAPGGRVEIRVPAAAADEALWVAGDFNGWEPVPMRRAGDAWTLPLTLPPGVYRYAFQRADGTWFVPDSVPGRIDDGFGGESAVLVVAGGAEG